jgi:hypothetical protein
MEVTKMANEFVCERCGWQEVDHIINRDHKWDDKAYQRRTVVKKSFKQPLLGKEGCKGRYTVSLDERKAVKALKMLVKPPSPPSPKKNW